SRSVRLWAARAWQPGRAHVQAHPSAERLRAAGVALAQLHISWVHESETWQSCPAVERRMSRWRLWNGMVSHGWCGPFETRSEDCIGSCATRAFDLVVRWIASVPALLEPWSRRPVAIQPCLCDVWHDHLLFEGNVLTGLIDYGSVKSDHVAVDLARLLGSLVGDDREAWATGIAAYRSVRPLTGEEEALAAVLDRTGTILAAATWLRWLYWDKRQFADE